MSLQQIQQKLKAPKNQYNEFGKYKYRNQEDILEALKPVLAEYQYSIVISDTVEDIAGRVYIKAHVTLYDADMKVVTESMAYAREPSEKKGMDPAQVSGATSSYARKYALNGLFAIDDTKDADSSKPETGSSGPAPKPINADQAAQIRTLLKETNSDFARFCKYMGVEKVEDITVKDFNKAVSALQAKQSGGKK